MKRISYSESQIISILKEAESGIPVPELCRKHGMGNSTFYKWRAKSMAEWIHPYYIK